MRFIDADKLIKDMNKRYNEKKDIVPDNLAEGFMQMEKLIHEQDVFDLAEHDRQIRDEVKTCDGCKHNGKWENEIEYGYNSPCTLCRRRCLDNYEADESEE